MAEIKPILNGEEWMESEPNKPQYQAAETSPVDKSPEETEVQSDSNIVNQLAESQGEDGGNGLLNTLGSLAQGAGNLLLRGDIDPEQAQQIIEQGKQNPVNQGDGPEGIEKVVAEVGKGVLGAPTALGAKLAGAAEFAGDVAGGVADAAGVVDRAEEDIPWSENYKYAEYDLGAFETNTWYGGLVQEGVAFAMGGGAIGGAAKAVGLGAKGQAAASVAGDFVLDYFSSVEGGNISNMVQSGPLANPLSAALAHGEEDNPHWRRIKNSIEGAMPSIGLVAVSRLYKGMRRGNEIIAAGGSAEEATEAARKVAQADPAKLWVGQTHSARSSSKRRNSCIARDVGRTCCCHT